MVERRDVAWDVTDLRYDDDCTIQIHDAEWNGTNDDDRVWGEEGD